MYLDIVIGIIFLVGIYIGSKKGFYFEIISFFLLIVDLVIAKKITPSIQKIIQGSSKIPVKESIFYFIVFIGTLIVLYILTNIILCILGKTLPNVLKGAGNIILGGILGGLKSGILVIVILIIYNFLGTIIPSINQYSKDSKANEIFLDNVSKFDAYYPSEVTQKIEELKLGRKLKKKIDEIF